MANNYIHFSFAVQLDDEKQIKWVETLLGLGGKFDGEEHLPYNNPISELLLKIQPDWEDDPMLGFEWKIDSSGELFIYTDDGEGNTSSVANFLKLWLYTFNIKEAVGFEFCWTCSKSRTGEFGGGACLVTAESEEWFQSTTWLRDKIAALS